MSKQDNSYCPNWCTEDHPGHHPENGDTVVIVSELVYGLQGRQAIVLRQAEGSEHGDVKIKLLDDSGNTSSTMALTVYYTEIGPVDDVEI